VRRLSGQARPSGAVAGDGLPDLRHQYPLPTPAHSEAAASDRVARASSLNVVRREVIRCNMGVWRLFRGGNRSSHVR
jgi:hypothetical protein